MQNSGKVINYGWIIRANCCQRQKLFSCTWWSNQSDTNYNCRGSNLFMLLFMSMEVRLCPWKTASKRPQIIYGSGGPWWNHINKEKQRTRWKSVPMPLYRPQIPHGLTWAGTRASALRGQWLTAWAMAWPVVEVTTALFCFKSFYCSVTGKNQQYKKIMQPLSL
jgi:hypothetical protein